MLIQVRLHRSTPGVSNKNNESYLNTDVLMQENFRPGFRTFLLALGLTAHAQNTAYQLELCFELIRMTQRSSKQKPHNYKDAEK